MDEDGTFNRLSLELSLDERVALLEKLKNQSSISREPLYTDTSDVPSFDPERQFSQLPWYDRLWFWLLSLFKNRPPLKLFEDRETVKLGKAINARAPGFYDHTRGMLLPEFYRMLDVLKESSRFFYTALDSSVNRDKGAFFAFLGSLEMGGIHTRLEKETAPQLIAEKNPEAPEGELRQIAAHLMGEIISVVSEDERTCMYANARSLICLKQLSSFLFDRMLMAFTMDSAAAGMTCSAPVLRDSLASLNNILFSLKEIPSMTLLESMFIFILQEQVGETGFDINAEIHRLLGKAENALATIRDFNQQIPLTLLCRCASRNLSLTPREISGGEDWFAVYQEYWKNHIDERFSEFLYARRQQELTGSFQSFLKGMELRGLDSARSEINPDGMPIDGLLSLSFLRTFYAAVFMPDLNKVLRPLLIDGEFIKRENRVEFTEAYNELITLEDNIKALDTEIGPEGDLGSRYAQIRGDMSSLQVKRRKEQILVEEASETSVQLVARARAALANMGNVLKGIAAKEPVGPYSSLLNIKEMAKKMPGFIAAVGDAVPQLEKAARILNDIAILEEGV